MKQTPDRNRVIVIAGMLVALAVIAAVLIPSLLDKDTPDAPAATASPTATFTPSETQASEMIPSPSIEDDHAHDEGEGISESESKKISKTVTEYIDAWASVEGEKARRKALSGLATPGNVDLMAYTDPRNLGGVKRDGAPEVLVSDTYSATARVTLDDGQKVYAVLTRDPSMDHDWAVAYLYPEDEYQDMGLVPEGV